MISRRNLADKIRIERLKRRMSQKDLAEEIGSHTCQVSWWETERYEPSIYYIDKLCKVFNTDLNTFLEFNNNG